MTRLEAAFVRWEAQIAALQLTVREMSEPHFDHTRSTHYGQDVAALQERIIGLESRVFEQEQTIRHTLTMLIDWIEQDQAHCVAA